MHEVPGLANCLPVQACARQPKTADDFCLNEYILRGLHEVLTHDSRPKAIVLASRNLDLPLHGVFDFKGIKFFPVKRNGASVVPKQAVKTTDRGNLLHSSFGHKALAAAPSTWFHIPGNDSPSAHADYRVAWRPKHGDA